MIGLKLKVPPATFADAALGQRLLLIPAGDNVVRVVPPLVVTDEEMAEGVARLDAACEAVKDRLAVAIN
jgi:acetylornithine/N-succinyldiaminopimelate aminotransferase